MAKINWDVIVDRKLNMSQHCAKKADVILEYIVWRAMRKGGKIILLYSVLGVTSAEILFLVLCTTGNEHEETRVEQQEYKVFVTWSVRK